LRKPGLKNPGFFIFKYATFGKLQSKNSGIGIVWSADLLIGPWQNIFGCEPIGRSAFRLRGKRYHCQNSGSVLISGARHLCRFNLF
jgi:hypothetical protein